MPKSSSRARNFLRARKSIKVALAGPLLGLFGVLAVCFSNTPIASAATSSYLNFQARLMSSNGAIVQDGNYNVEFKIYSASTSSGSTQGSCTGDAACLWTETRTGANQVRVVDGYLTVNLGSVTAFPSTMPWDQQLWLTMNIGGTGTPGWDGEMNPRIQLTAIPYAFKANAAAQIQNSSGSTLLTTSGNQISLPNATGSSSALTFGGDTTADLYRSASGTLKTDGSLNIAGALGIGVVNPQGALTIANGAWINSVDASGSGNINILSVNSSNQIQLGAALAVDGGIVLPTDAGQVTFSDLPIDSSAASGTKESYTMRVGSTNALTVYGESDGAGGVQNVRIAVGGSITPGYTLDVSGDVNTSGVYRVGGVQICSSTGCTPDATSNSFIQNQTSTTQAASFKISGSGQINGNLSLGNSNLTAVNNIVISDGGPSEGLTWQDSSWSVDTSPLDRSNTTGNLNLFNTSNNVAIWRPVLYVQDASNYATATAGSGGSLAFTSTGTGGFSFQTGSNSASAFQIQNASGAQLLGVDSTAGNGNLVTQSDMESSVSAWTSKGTSTVSQTTSQYYQGAHSVQAVVTAASSGLQTSTFSSSIQPSTQYQLTFYARCSSTISTFTYGRQDVSGTDINNTTTSTCSSSGWTAFTWHFTTGATITSPNIYMTMGSTSSGTLYIDAVSLIQTTTSAFQPYENGAIQINGVINTPTIIMPTSSSTNAFSVENGTGTTTTLNVDTLNNRVNVGLPPTSSYGANLNVAGTYISRTNSATAFQVQASSGNLSNIFDIDTTSTNNLLTNTDFEANGTSGWSVKNGAGLTRVATQAWQGNDSLQVASTTSANSGASYSFTMTASTQYTLSLYAKVASGSISDFELGRQDVSGTDIDCLTGQTLTTNWKRFSCTFTTGATITSSNIYTDTSGSVAETFFVDGVMLQTGANATPYNPGGGIMLEGLVNSPAVFQNKVDSATSFQVQNAAGTSNLLVADTLDNVVGIGQAPIATGSTLQVNGSISATSQIGFSNTGNANQGITLNMVVTSAVNAGDVVVIDTSNAGQVTDSTTANSTQVVGIATTTNSAGVAQPIVMSGVYQVNVTGTVNVGDYLVTSTTTGTAQATSTPTGGVIGQALSTASGGKVWALIRPSAGGGGTTNTTINYNSYGLMESDFTNVGSLPAANGAGQAVTVGNTIYLFGGATTGGTVSNKIYSAPVSNPTNWTDLTATLGKTMPGNITQGQVAIIGSTIYYFGGNNGSGPSNVIYSASTSDPATWTNTGSTIATATYGAKLAIIGSYVYLFDGYNGGDLTTIQRASLASPTSWSNVGNTAASEWGPAVAVIGNYVYLFGGDNGGGGGNTTIQRATVANPLSWSTVTGTLPTGIGQSSLAIVGNYIYLFGSEGSQTSIYRAPINDPTNGWTSTGIASIPSGALWGAVTIAGNALYILGGYNSSSPTANILSAPIYNGSPDVSSNPSWITDSNYSAGGGGSGTSSQTANGNYELAYGTATGTITTTNTSYSSPDTLITAPSFTADGASPYIVQAYVPIVEAPSNNYVNFELFDNGTNVYGTGGWERVGQIGSAASLTEAPLSVSIKLTPSAGSHQYSLRWFMNSAGTGKAYMAEAPGYVRVTLANPQLQGGSGIANGTTTQTANFNVQSSSASSVTAVIQGATSQSADILDVRNSSSANLLSVDASGNLTVAGNIGFSNTGNANQALTVSENITGSVTAGDVVVIDTANAGYVKDSSSANSTQVFGIATKTQTGGSEPVVISGIYQVNVTGTVNVGDYLVTSSTTGQAQSTTSPSGGIVGQTMSTASGGKAWALIKPASGAGGGGSSSSNNYGLMESDWSNVGSLPAGFASNAMATIGNTIYIFGGGNSAGTPVNTIYSAPVSSPTSWSSVGTIAPATNGLSNSSLAIIGSNIYLFGGTTSAGTINTIFTAPVSNPTSWTSVGTVSPASTGIAASSLAIIGSNIYLFGGWNGSSPISTIYTASISNPTSWSTASGTIPGALRYSQLAVIGNYVYLFGGNNSTGSTNSTNVIYRAPVSNPAGVGSWTSAGTLPAPLEYSGLTIIGNYIYLLGGYTTSWGTSVYRAPIGNPVGGWTNSGVGQLPATVGSTTPVIAGNAVYLFGGYNGSSNTTAIYSAPIYNGSPDVSSNPSWITDSNYSAGGGGSGTSSQTANTNTELDYATYSGNATVSSTSSSSPSPIMSASKSITTDGNTPIYVQFYAPYSQQVPGQTLNVDLWDGSTDLGIMDVNYIGGSNAFNGPIYGTMRILPSAGSHSYSVKAFLGLGSSTEYISSATGGPGGWDPMYLRITLANPQIQGGSGIANGTTTQTANFNVQSSSASSVTAVIQGATSQSADILEVKDSSNTNLLAVDPSGNLTVKGNIGFANQGNANQGITLNMKVTSAVTAGDVVVIDTANAGQVTDSTSANSTKVFGIATQTKSAGQYQPIVVSGLYQINVGSNSVNIGDYLVTDGSAGEAMASSSPTGGVVGQATSTASSSKVWALIKPASGTGGSGGGGMTTLYDSTLTSDTAGFDVSSIPGTYSQLKIAVYGRTAMNSQFDQIALRFNGDSSADYDFQKVEGNNTAVNGAANTGMSSASIGWLPGSSASNNTFAAGSSEATITNYAGTSFHKSFTAINSSNVAYTAASLDGSTWSDTWTSTSAINRIQVISMNGSNFKAGSRLVIYGIGGSNSGGSGSGGSGIVGVQTYTSGSGTFNLPAGVTSLQVELVGAGGGGGLGNQYGSGGGGGAGGYVRKFISSPSSSYSYAVGAAGAPWGGGAHTSGGTTTFGALSATGGTDAGGGTAPAGGTGGTGTGGDVNVTGGTGNDGAYNYTGQSGGNGGASYFGGGGAGGNYTTAGGAGVAYGSGGGGAGGISSSSLSGGYGAGGVIIVTEYGTSLQGGAGIQNGTTLQIGANFNIQSASPSSVTAVIHGTSGQSADILDVQNSSNINLLSVDPNGNTFVAGNLNVGGTIGFSNIGNQNQGISLNMVVTSSVTAGDVVVVDTTNAGQVTDSTTANSTKVFGVATTTNSSGVSQPIIVSGIYQVNVDTAAVNIGDYLVTSSTIGRATDSTSPSGGVIGQALSAKSAGSNGTVWARINPGNGAGGSGSGGAGYGLMESDFTSAGTLPGPVASGATVTVGNTIYMLGGQNTTTNTNKIYSAPVSNPTNWTDTGATIPAAIGGMTYAIVGNYLYLFGGINSSGQAVNAIYYAPLSNIASTAAWTTVSNPFPNSIGQQQLAIVGSNIYMMGGVLGSSLTLSQEIWSAPVSNPLSWSNTGGTIPDALRFSSVAVIGNYVYLFGGGGSSAVVNKIYRASISDPVHTWTTTSGILPHHLETTGNIAIVGNYVYIFGGYDADLSPSAGYTNVIYKAPITNPVGAWSTAGTSTIPVASSGTGIYIVGNALYLAGGANSGANAYNTLYSAPIINGSPDVSSNPSWIVDSNASSGGSGTSSQTTNTNTELAYGETTSPVTVTASTTPGTVLVTAPSITTDGNTPILVTFYTPYINATPAGKGVYFNLYDGSTESGFLNYTSGASSLNWAPGSMSVRLTPSAGTHTYTVNAHVDSGGTTYIEGGTGGGANWDPIYIRITLANPLMQGGSGINNGTTTQTANFNIQSSSASNVAAVIQGATSQSADILDVRNGSGSNLLSVDASGNLGVTGAIGFNNSGNANQIMTVNEKVTSSANQYDVVVIDTNNAGQVTTTTLANSSKVFGVATKTTSAGTTQPIAISGIYQVNVDTAAVNVGDYLVTSGTAGLATDSAYPSGGVIGQAMSAKTAGSNGTVWVRLNPGNGSGGSGSGAGYGLMESEWQNTGATMPGGGDMRGLYTVGSNMYEISNTNIYTATTSNPTNWTDTGAVFPMSLIREQVVTVGSYVYTLGGYQNGVGYTANIYRASVSTPTSFSLYGTLPGALGASQAAIIGNYVYLFGGNNGGVVSTIYKASIADLSTTGWSTYGTAGNIAVGVWTSQLAVIGNYVYLFGGENSGATNYRVIQRAPISNPLLWTNMGNLMPGNGVGYAQSAIIGNYIYIFGGWNPTNGYLSTMYRAPVNDPVNGWGSAPIGSTLPAARGYSQVAIAGNAVYLLGGSDSMQIWSAPIYSNGGPDASSNPSWKVDSNYSLGGGGSGTSSQTANGNYELAYGQFTSNVSSSATTDATAVTLVTASSFTASGSAPVHVHLSIPLVYLQNNGQQGIADLFDNGTELGRIGVWQSNSASVSMVQGSADYEYTPSAGSHVLTVGITSTGGSVTMEAGNGGANTLAPGFIRVTLANPNIQGGTGGILNGTTTQTGNINIQSSSASNPTMVLQGATSQSADILDVKNSSGSILFNVGPTGNVSVAGNLAVSGTVVLGASTSDPGCTNGGLYYNTTSYQIRGCANGAWNSLNGIDIVTTIPTTNLHDGETVYLKVSAPADYLKLTYDAAQGHWYSEADATINELPSATTLNSSAWSPYGAMPLSNCMSLYNAGLRPQIYVSGYMNSSGTGTTTYIRASLYTHGGSSASPYGSLWATGPSVSVFANNVYQIANWADATYSGAPANAECELSVEYNTASVNATYENLGAMVRWRSQ